MKDGVARKLGRATAHRWSMLRCAPSSVAAGSLCGALHCALGRLACQRAVPAGSHASAAACRTMVSQLIFHERIETTVQKARAPRAANQRGAASPNPGRAAQAKEVRKIADHMVTLGKDGSLAARRRAAAVVRGDVELKKLFSELAERYAPRAGGYTRVLQTRRRMGDGAQMAFVEYIDRPGEMRPAMPPNPDAAAAQTWARERAARWTRGGLLPRAAEVAAAKAPRAAAKAATAPN
jgi:large subunit ribosomal protein L17